MIGRKLSNFHINERIGEGGMGTVYKATDLGLNRTVAIKMLHPFLVSNPDSFKRFRNEAHLSARISHPNVATLFDFQEVDQSHFIVMEYVQGKALDDILKVQEQLPEEEAVKITLEVLEGLGAAHELGIMHRDLKPGNIMVTNRGFVKLMDFGIARMENTERMTRQNSVIGTLEYLAPELIKGEAPSKGSDLYAVGVMLHEMISGQTLHAGDSEAALMYQIAHQQPKIQLKGVSKALIQVVKKLTHKQLSKRYPSTQEAIQDLEKIHRGGKVNTLLLKQKLAPAQASSKTALPQAFTVSKLSIPKMPSIPAMKMPFDMDLRIIAGAALVCLLILIFGINRSGENPEPGDDPQFNSLSENGKNANTREDERAQFSPSNLPDPQQAKKEITFITKFDEDENPLNEDDRQTRQSESIAQSPRSEKKTSTQPVSRVEREVVSESPVKKEQAVTTDIKDEPKRETPDKKEDFSDKVESVEEKVVEQVDKIAKILEQKPRKKDKPKGSVKVRVLDTYMSASFAQTVSTETNREGETVYLTTLSPVYKGEHLIVPQGAQIKAVIKKLKKSVGNKKAFLSINLLSVKAVNGRWLTVSYPEYSNLSKTRVEFKRGQQLNKIKLKATNITLNY